jgi:DNA-binding Lrp family transcriptional regulator
MNLEQLRQAAARKAGLTSLPIDQCRRRVTALTEAGVITGTKVPTEKNRWDYPEEAVELLVRVLRLEKTGMSAKRAVTQVVEETLGKVVRTTEEVEEENRTLLERNRQLAEELSVAQEKIRTMREERRYLPVEWSPFRALLSGIRNLFSSWARK